MASIPSPAGDFCSHLASPGNELRGPIVRRDAAVPPQVARDCAGPGDRGEADRREVAPCAMAAIEQLLDEPAASGGAPAARTTLQSRMTPSRPGPRSLQAMFRPQHFRRLPVDEMAAWTEPPAIGHLDRQAGRVLASRTIGPSRAFSTKSTPR